MNEEQSAALASNVADWLKDHQYTQLVKTDAVEVWRCKAPGNTNLAFDITITRFGMGVMGDIGGLTFSVGSSYGVQWIANTSMGNLHGKLESHCKQVWIDKDEILDKVRECICEALDEDGIEYPDGTSVEALLDWLRAQDGEDTPFDEWVDLLECIDRLDERTDRDVVRAFDLIAENEKLLRTGDTWEWSFDKPSDHVWRKLFYVQHAAKQIVAQLQAAAESAAAEPAIEYAYATSRESEQWHSDSLASFVSDNEIAAGTEVFRGVIDRPKASSFMVEADDVINHMANQAYDNNSEYADNFPDLKPEHEEELKALLVPLEKWADERCDVNFYTVEQIEPYIVTADDVAAAGAYLKAQSEQAGA